MKLTTKQIHQSSFALRDINASTDITMLTAIKLANNIQAMKTTVEEYNKRHDKVVMQYREKVKSTVEGGPDIWEIPAKDLEKFNTEKIKLDNESIDIKLSQISIKDLPEGKVPSPAQINLLRWLFNDLDEYLAELESKELESSGKKEVTETET